MVAFGLTNNIDIVALMPILSTRFGNLLVYRAPRYNVKSVSSCKMKAAASSL